MANPLSSPLRWARTNENLLGVLVTTVLVNTGQGVMSPVLALYAESLGVSIALVGLAIGAFGLGRLFMNIPAGILADRFGQRVIMSAGPLIVAVAALLMGFSHEYWQLLVLRFLQGIGGGMYTTTATVYVSQIAGPERRARYASYQQSGQTMGSGIGPAFGGIVAELFGLRAPFFVIAALGMIAFVWALVRIREATPDMLPGTQRAVPGQVTSNPRSALRELLTTPTFLVACLFTFSQFGAASSGRQSLVPLRMDSLGFSPGQIGFMLTMAVVAQFSAIAVFGGLSDKLGRRVVILPATVAMCIGMIAFVLTNNYWALIVLMMLMQGSEGLTAPIPVAFVGELARKVGKPGLAFGVYRTFGDAGVVLAPIILGVIADRFGYTPGLLTGSALVLIAAVAVVLLAKEPGRRRPPSTLSP